MAARYLCLLVLWLTQAIAAALPLQAITRAETIAIAESYAQHRWAASDRNVLHGLDANRIDVQTPNSPPGEGPREGYWKVGGENVGVPYKWGGFDSLASFAAGIQRGRAAGDLYTAEKRKKGGAAVSPQAVGVDCSGFISRCWKLPRKHSTSTLADVSRRLSAPSELEAGDIMNQPGGHVLLFARWLDADRSRALFYEAEPFSKVIASEHVITEMSEQGYRPLRYKAIR